MKLRQRTRESVVRNPSGPRRARVGPAGPPLPAPPALGGGPEGESHVATGEASVQVTAPANRFVLLPRAGRCCETGCWRRRRGGAGAARSRLSSPEIPYPITPPEPSASLPRIRPLSRYLEVMLAGRCAQTRRVTLPHTRTSPFS